MIKHQLKKQIIYCGDNIITLKGIPGNSVDLIYIDPPFNSNRNYETFWEDTQQKRAFEDRFGDAQAYIDYMRPRVTELHRILKDTGSFYYHCDWHASHYIKIMLDQIFNFNNFQNEIIWHYEKWTSPSKKSFQKNHDTILFYSKSPNNNLNIISTITKNLEDKYKKGYSLGGGYGSKGLIVYDKNHPKVKDLIASRKYKVVYASKEGKPLSDVWSIPFINPMAKERLGYPTQKPLSLLERIIKASSNKGDIVLDAFCGCGTTLVAAEKLGRKWIGIDISPTACRVMADRLWDIFKLNEGKDFFVEDLPRTEKELRALPHFEFENWAVIALGGTPTKKTGDMGIDGKLYVADRAKSKEDGQGLFGTLDIYYPIQVKQQDKVGRPDIDSFSSAMRRDKRTKGYFVAFSYTSGAIKEVKRLEKTDGIEMICITANELLKYQ